MKRTNQKIWKHVFQIVFLIAFMAPVTTGFSTPNSIEITCGSPTVSITSQTSSSVSFAWNAVSGATIYKIWYVRNGSDGSGEFFTSGTSMTFNNLQGGSYRFYFQAICSEGSSEITIEDLVIG